MSSASNVTTSGSVAGGGGASTGAGASGGSGAAGAGAGAKAPNYNEPMAELSLLVILCALSFFILVFLPRAIARMSFKSMWAKGWILRSGPGGSAFGESRVAVNGGPETAKANIRVLTFAKNGQILPHEEEKSWFPDPVDNLAVVHQPPPHFPAWTTILSPVSQINSKTSFFGYSFGRLVLLAAYAGLIAGVTFSLSNPVTSPKRAGWIAISQFPVVFILGTKNSIVGLLVARGYERLNYLHRWVGRVIFIALLFHVVGYLVKWTKAGNLSTEMQLPVSVTGMIAFGGMVLLAVVSIAPIRAWSYNLFWHSHWIGFATMLIAGCYHVPATIPYAAISAGFYALDILCRTIKSRYMTATIEYIPDMRSTRIALPSLNRGWRAGQHVRIMVLSMKMGVTRVFESHPFTIASAGDGGADGLVLYVKRAGDWTGALADLARVGSGKEGESMSIEQNVKVIVQGPYGGPGNTVFSSFSAAMLVCGGSGITFGLAMADEMMRHAYEGCSRVRSIDLVWVVQDSSSLVSLLPILQRLYDRSTVTPSTSIRISVFYTRASSFSPAKLPADRPITLMAGRPSISEMLFDSLNYVASLKDDPSGSTPGRSGVIVGVCGPMGLVNQVREVEASVGHKARKDAGGLELVEEAFGW